MFCYWAEAKAARAWARMQNENIAALCATHPDRLVGLATLPMQDPGLAVEELRWVREQLGLRAVEIGTFPGNRDFDDPILFAFFEACTALDVAVFVHPAMPVAAGDRLARYDVREIAHYPLETTIAIAALIFGGVLERLPRLRIGFAHAGGTLPFLLGRFDHGWAVRTHLHETAPRPPAEYVRRLYVDSLTHSAATLRLVVETMAPGAVMMGSDYPLNMGAADPVGAVSVAGLDAMVEAGVLGGNAVSRYLSRSRQEDLDGDGDGSSSASRE
ncbi:MAG: hypothetical protein AUH30_01815 [Candidatus Rokubacteria bacterium 13_1_40CM_68_15]|nr:MAG: hypothetical protein AUH30_01815 [Candidatus Rokubacteria bacterium 13_1_40CM_68_15]